MGNSLPDFNDEGCLPPGDYVLTFEELRASSLVIGAEGKPWDERVRRRLVDRCEVLTRQLVGVGVSEIFIDGSFAEDKPKPGDIDGYFLVPGAPAATTADLADTLKEMQKKLFVVNPGTWTWSDQDLKRDPFTGKLKLPMWFRYKVELWPHIPGVGGIVDEYGNQLQFPAAFRRSRAKNPRGIVKLGGLT